MSNTFCVLPWIHQAVRNNGTVRVCCQTNQGSNKGLLKKDDNTFFNAGSDSLPTARNAELLKKIRLNMLNNEWSQECTRCQTEESTGIRSRRIYEQQRWTDFKFEDAKKLTALDGTIQTNEIPVQYFDLRFGNKCNLKCRSCSPTDSNSWYEDYYNLWGSKYQDGQFSVILEKDEDGIVLPDKNIYDWYQADHFWNNLKKNASSIRQIYMVGGEPLLITEHYNFLEKCIDLDYAKNIEIEYNSNGTVLPEKALDLWKHFKKVRLGISIDGVAEINDYIRFPSKWALIEKNLDRLDTTDENIDVWIAHTVMALNISQLPEFIIWRIQKKFKKINLTDLRPVMSAHPLHSPTYLNAQVLFPETKAKILNKYNHDKVTIENVVNKSAYSDQFKEKLKQHSFKLLDQYAQFMFVKDLSSQNEKFKMHVSKLNELRKQDTPTKIINYL
jgi:organic radical activating enzyme